MSRRDYYRPAAGGGAPLEVALLARIVGRAIGAIIGRSRWGLLFAAAHAVAVSRVRHAVGVAVPLEVGLGGAARLGGGSAALVVGVGGGPGVLVAVAVVVAG